MLSGNNDINFPTISFPTTNSTTSLTIAYSGTVDANFVFDNVVQNSSGLSLYKADFNFGDGTTQTRYSSFLSSGELKLENFSHNYTSFNNSLSTTGSVIFYYENGKTATVNLTLFKIITNHNTLNLKTLNGQKTNSDNYVCNLVDKNNTIYNFIDTTTKSSTNAPF